MNGNGDYLTKFIGDGNPYAPGLAFGSELDTGICREAGNNSSMTLVKKGKKRLRITDTETQILDTKEQKKIRVSDEEIELIGPIVASEFFPDKLILDTGEPENPSLTYVDNQESGFFYNTGSREGPAVSTMGETAVVFNNASVFTTDTYGFMDSECGIHTRNGGPGEKELVLSADHDGDRYDNFFIGQTQCTSTTTLSSKNVESLEGYGFVNKNARIECTDGILPDTEDIDIKLLTGPGTIENVVQITPDSLHTTLPINSDADIKGLSLHSQGLAVDGYSETKELAVTGTTSMADVHVSGSLTCSGQITTTDIHTSNFDFTGAGTQGVLVTGPSSTVSSRNAYSTTTLFVGDGTNNFTMSQSVGRYVRLGPLVFLSGTLAWTDKGSADPSLALKIGPVPVNTTAINTPGQIGVAPATSGSWSITGNLFIQYIGPPTTLNITHMNVYETKPPATTSIVSCGMAPDAGGIRFAITYLVN